MNSAQVSAEAGPAVLIVGAGPAALSCALWLHNLGLRPWVIDRAPRVGGLMNQNTLPNEWVLGHMGFTGPQLAAQFGQHLARLGLRVSLGIEGFEVHTQAPGFAVKVRHATAPEAAQCAALVLATGTRVRAAESLADVAGLATVTAYVRYGPPAFDDIAGAAQGRTLVVGGGDNAVENARMIVAAGGEVVVVARSHFRAQAGLMTTLLDHARARRVRGDRLRSLQLTAGGFVAELITAQGSERIEAQRLHVLTGYEPNTDLQTALDAPIWQGLQRDPQGYLQVDADGRCGPARVYAAGDVCNPAFPSVVSAMAQGARVAKTIERDLRLADF